MRNIGLILFALVLSICSFAMEVQLSHAVFQGKNQQPYTEVYLWIPAWNLKPGLQSNGTYQVNIECTILFKKDSANITYDKFKLNSRDLVDTNDVNFAIVDLKRYALAPGKYTVQLQAKDMNNSQDISNFIFDDILVKDTMHAAVSFSEINLIDTFYASTAKNSFVKNDMFLQPLVIDFYDNRTNKLNFYTELYHADKFIPATDRFLLKTSIKDIDMKDIERFVSYKKVNASDIMPILQSFNIEQLTTGNYYLFVEAIDKNNKTFASQKIFFQRLNLNVQDTINISTFNSAEEFGKGYLDTASLNYLHFAVLSLTPIAPYGDISYLQELSKSTNRAFIIQYLTKFWKSKDPLSPEFAWKKYEEQVQLVERTYSTTMEHGFQTDRGRVFLKYGVPSNITKNKESASYDYEIWQYYSLKDGQTNVRFVFYNPTMINNSMQLLHSTARGETTDPQWKLKIYGATSGKQSVDFDNNNFQQHTGSQLNRAIDDF